MTVLVGRPIGAAELVAQLEKALAKLVGEVGEPEALREALHLVAALKLATGVRNDR